MDDANHRRSVLIVGPVAPCDGGRAPGGVSQHVSGLARALARAGWHVAVYADDVTPSSGAAIGMEWGTLYGPVAPKRAAAAFVGLRGSVPVVLRMLRNRSRAKALGTTWRSVVAHTLGLRIAWERTRPDVVHYQHADLRPYWGVLAGIDAPMVITAHSLSAFRDSDNPALHEVTQDALRRADAVIAVSADTVQTLTERVPGVRPVVIGNGIELSTFATADVPEDDVAGRVVLYHGRVAAQKGMVQLIEAMAVVRQRVPDAVLVIVGVEEDVSVVDLATQSGLDPSAVRATGYLEMGQVAAWLHRAAVVVMPSIVREGQSRSIIEAMAAGRPIVASRIGAVPTLLAEGEYGLLVEPGDSMALAAAIEQLLLDRATAEMLGEKALEAASAFDIGVVADRVSSIYQDAIARHGN